MSVDNSTVLTFAQREKVSGALIRLRAIAEMHHHMAASGLHVDDLMLDSIADLISREIDVVDTNIAGGVA